MTHDKEDKRFYTDQKVGGYNVGNIFDNNLFITKKRKVINLSFEINDIVETQNNSEILKLLFFNSFTVRIMKFQNSKGSPSSTFDIVDELNKIILLKTEREFIGGLGIAELFYKMDFLTQWEVPIFAKLCRAFVLGDPEAIRNLMKDYHVKISKNTEWNLKIKLGLDQ